MDFLKSCTTNVHLVEDVHRTCYTRFSCGNPVQISYGRLCALLANLRQRGILCRGVKHELYVFGPLDAETQDSLQHGDCDLRQVEQRTVENDALARADDGRAIKDVLLDAILDQVSFRLVRNHGFLRMDAWTWITRDTATDEQSQYSSVLLRLKLRLSGSGALYATNTVQPFMRSVPNAREHPQTKEDSVILIPSGLQANILAQPDKQAAASDEWKSIVTHGLQAGGIDVDKECVWLFVHLSAYPGQVSFMWPAYMCLRRTLYTAQISPCNPDQADWTTWFAASEDIHGYRNPLAVAEEWFADAPNRDKAAADAVAPQLEHDVPDVSILDNLGSENFLLTSPPFAQRNADQQAAMSGIYPTPPDGLVPGHILQQLSSDSVAAVIQTEPNGLGSELMPDSDNARERDHTLSSDSPPFQHGTDDLFGDVGGTDFGGDEVGDADFDFFNEQEEAASEQHNHGVMLIRDHQTSSVGEEGTPHSETVEDMEIEHRSETVGLVPDSPRFGTSTPAGGPLETLISIREPDQAIVHTRNDPIAATGLQGKPLSPFTIKERLLPPPIPASSMSTNAVHSNGIDLPKHRRHSTFDPVTFSSETDLNRKYIYQYAATSTSLDVESHLGGPTIGLPQKHKKPRFRRPADQADQDPEALGESSESGEDSYESASSMSDEGLPPKLPWETKKRKRTEVNTLSPLAGSFDNPLSDGDTYATATDCRSELQTQTLMAQLLGQSPLTNKSGANIASGGNVSVVGDAIDGDQLSINNTGRLPSMEVLFQLSKLDLIYTAQLVSEQAVTCMPHVVRSLDQSAVDQKQWSAIGAAAVLLAENTLKEVMPSAERCDVVRLALVREPPSRTAAAPSKLRPGQPRPPQRSEGASLGPDIIPMAAPYTRVKRSQETYEMLPPALDFWQPLSLAPSNGPKDVRAFAVFPLNEDLQKLVEAFLRDVGTVYETCRLGSHVSTRNVQGNNELDDYEDGLAPVELGGEETVDAALSAYCSTCVELGTFLASIGRAETDRTIVIYLVDPFSVTTKASQYLCACFWQLYKAYRDNTPRLPRNQARSDIVLQIVPIELIASKESLITLNAQQLEAMAKEVHDRCPPSRPSDAEVTSELPNFAAPFVELASPPPKRVGFQLTADPPRDLLHEGSVLHLAYATSADGQWIVAAWTDNTGRYHSSVSFCLRGKSFAEVAEDVWERTRDIMIAREVTWRVFIITAEELDNSTLACWRALIEQPRRQAFSVTLLFAELDPGVGLTPPDLSSDDTSNSHATLGAGFLTPATTPQGTTVTVSPDTGGYNAPPTPAPSETAIALVENDPDALLIDLSDESWGVLYSPALFAMFPSCGIAHGALFKRGPVGLETGSDPITRAQLPCMLVSLTWTIQVRPNGQVDEGNVKQAEVMLRDVLKLYRNLTVLTKARGLHDGEDSSAVPVHLATALKGAAGLDRLLF